MATGLGPQATAAATPPPTDATATGVPAPPTPSTATPTSVPAPGLLEIVYGRSGGVAGASDTLEIWATGEAHLSSRGQSVGTTSLTAAQLDSLLAQFDQVDSFDLQERDDSGNVADDIYHSITLSRNGQSKTVTVAEVGGQGLTPPALGNLITTLGQIADTIRAQPPASPTTAPALSGSPTTGPTEGSDLIIYRVQGGIAGLDTGMYIDRRGGVRFTSRGADTGTAQMSADDLRALIDLFNAGDFFNLQDRYAPPVAPSDSQTLTGDVQPYRERQDGRGGVGGQRAARPHRDPRPPAGVADTATAEVTGEQPAARQAPPGGSPSSTMALWTTGCRPLLYPRGQESTGQAPGRSPVERKGRGVAEPSFITIL